MGILAEKVTKQKTSDVFKSSVLDKTNPTKIDARFETLKKAMDSIIYGPVITRFTQLASSNDIFCPVEVTPETKAAAIDLLAKAALNSEKKYKEDHGEGIFEDPDFFKAIQEHHSNVARGDIQLVPEQFGTTAEQGKDQVSYADHQFSVEDPQIQLYLAGLNYAAFTSKTMYTGADLLGKNADVVRSLAEWSEKGIQEAMPHLVISNLGIGEIVSHIFSKTSKKNIPLNIIDTGSGYGATLAGIILGLTNNRDQSLANVNLTGIDTATAMYNVLVDEFSTIASQRLGQNFNLKTVTNPKKEVLDPNEFLLINGDMKQALAAINFSPQDANGLTVITANYSWHRIPSVIKDQMIKIILRKCKNPIFLVADLVENSSEVNKRYFNLRDNGLLNCGNRQLRATFKSNNMKVIDLNEQTAPLTMNNKLAKKIGQGTTSDSIFYVAYSGLVAENIVENWNKK